MCDETDELIANMKGLRKRLAAQTEVVRETGSRHIAEMRAESELRRQYATLENKLLSLIAGEERYSHSAVQEGVAG